MITTRPKRPPVAIATVAMQPVASDVHGLQGGSPGEATNDKELQPEHQPLTDSMQFIANPATAENPFTPPDVPQPEPARRLTIGPESGSTPEVLLQTAAEISRFEEVVRDARSRASSGAERWRGANSDDIGDQTSARFFGLGADGAKSVVYVIDCSGSMGGNKLELAKREMIRSIRALRADQEFHVIFFRNIAMIMRDGSLLPATAANKERVIEWINSVDSGGGTDPRPALTKALEVHPETIYVLSDGLFEAACVTEVKKANHGLNRATIYTVGFGDRTGEAQLTRLAKDSGGQYRFVEPDQ
jgi:Mg-chelatase subunit ChlD